MNAILISEALSMARVNKSAVLPTSLVFKLIIFILFSYSRLKATILTYLANYRPFSLVTI